MIKETLPIVKETLLKKKASLALLIVVSILLGIIPSMKSELESALINQISRVIEESPSDSKPSTSVFFEPLDRFASGTPSDSSDLSQRLAYRLFGIGPTWFALITYVLMALFAAWLAIRSTTIRAGLSRRLFNTLRRAGLATGLQTDPSKLPSLANIPGQYSMAIQQGAANISNTYGYVLEAAEHIFLLATTLFLLLTKSRVFASGCLLLVGGQVVISIVQARRLRKDREELDRRRNDLVARTDDILSKREIILAFEQQERYTHKLDKLTDNFAEIDRRLDVRQARYHESSKLITDYGRIGILLLSLVVIVIFGRSSIAGIGDAYFLISIYIRLFIPASNLLLRYDDIRRAQATSRTFLEVIQHRSTSIASPLPKVVVTSPDTKVEIVFNNVNFSYSPDSPSVLTDCSFKIPTSKTTLLLGRSGCGKTTIARILLGFWPITGGDVQINKKSITQYTGEELRLLMSYVSQQDYIIDDTVRDNLDWSIIEPKPTETEMRSVLKKVGIVGNGNTDILDMPASKLSHGQKQRLSLARMMLDRSPVLIIDEPLAGVDIFTFNDLYPEIKKTTQKPEHTVLIISHRLSFTGLADNIIILNETGNVEEEGTPEELLKNNGVYKMLHNTALADLNLSDLI